MVDCSTCSPLLVVAWYILLTGLAFLPSWDFSALFSSQLHVVSCLCFVWLFLLSFVVPLVTYGRVERNRRVAQRTAAGVYGLVRLDYQLYGNLKSEFNLCNVSMSI